LDEVVNTWNNIIEKAACTGLAALKHEEQVVFRANSFVVEVEMGGMSGALYNLSPKAGTDQRQWLDLRLTAQALASIGDHESAQLLLKAIDVFENLPEPVSSTWEEFMESASSQLSGEFWETIEARIPNIYDSLEKYTRTHLL
jgi:hypothetical protein